MSLACWGCYVEEQRTCILLKIMGVTARLPCCLATPGGLTLLSAGSVPLAVSGALHGLDGKKTKAPSTPRTLPGVGSERLLQFSPTV
jgi:hypothetical protein